ncbi:MAG TPA: hypothetical protein VF155_05070 [Candidatus Dormibacteraeota bacterium]
MDELLRTRSGDGAQAFHAMWQAGGAQPGPAHVLGILTPDQFEVVPPDADDSGECDGGASTGGDGGSDETSR